MDWTDVRWSGGAAEAPGGVSEGREAHLFSAGPRLRPEHRRRRLARHRRRVRAGVRLGAAELPGLARRGLGLPLREPRPPGAPPPPARRPPPPPPSGPAAPRAAPWPPSRSR